MRLLTRVRGPKELGGTRDPARHRAGLVGKERCHRRLLVLGHVNAAGRYPDARRDVTGGEPDPGVAQGPVDEQPPESSMLVPPRVRVRERPRPGGVVIERADNQLRDRASFVLSRDPGPFIHSNQPSSDRAQHLPPRLARSATTATKVRR